MDSNQWAEIPLGAVYLGDAACDGMKGATASWAAGRQKLESGVEAACGLAPSASPEHGPE